MKVIQETWRVEYRLPGFKDFIFLFEGEEQEVRGKANRCWDNGPEYVAGVRVMKITKEIMAEKNR